MKNDDGTWRGRKELTMLMTFFLILFLELSVKFWKMSQAGDWRSLKATARWWFSRMDSSLYMRARSESVAVVVVMVVVVAAVVVMVVGKVKSLRTFGTKHNC